MVWANLPYKTVEELTKAKYTMIVGSQGMAANSATFLKKVMEIYDYHEMRKYKAEDFYDSSYVRQLDQSGYIDSLYK